MLGTMLYGARDVRIEDLEIPTIVEATDAIVRLSATCICGSDLWPYRGIQETTQPDGETYGTPTWIWSVAIDGALYVRAYNGEASRWYQAARRQGAGRITAAAITKEVSFEPVRGAVNDRIDEAYRAKYRTSSYLAPMIGASARAATIKVIPQESHAIARGEEKQP
jgi:hypothetical protein